MTMWCRHCGHSVPSGIDYEPCLSGYREVRRYPDATAPCPHCGKDAAWSTYAPAGSANGITPVERLIANVRAMLAEWDRDMAVPRAGRAPADDVVERYVEQVRADLRAYDAATAAPFALAPSFRPAPPLPGHIVRGPARCLSGFPHDFSNGRCVVCGAPPPADDGEQSP